MKILFIIPPDDEKEKYLFKLKKGEGIYIPLGIAQIAAVLKKEKHHVKVLDLRLKSKSNLKEIKNEVMKFNPDFVGFSISFFSSKSIFKLSRFIKSFINKPIILGGQYASVFGEKILKDHKEIDFIVLNQGDYAFGKIISNWNKKSFKKINNILYRNTQGKIIKTKTVNQKIDLDKLPFPAMHLFDVKNYIPLPKHYKKLPVIPIITSRGCFWGRCSFCFQPEKFNRHSPSYIVSLIKYYIQKFDIKEVRFWDDTFIDGSNWIFEFCNLIKKDKIKISWSCHARVNLITKEVLEAVKKAGCHQIMYGIESGSQYLLDKISKGITLNQAENAVKWAKEAGLSVRNSFMLGLPGENPKLSDKTIEFALKLNADMNQFSFATPYPGTKMFEQCSKSGRLDSNLRNYCEYKIVYLPKGYRNKKQLQKKLKQAYAKSYLNFNYLFNSIKDIKTSYDIQRYYNGLKVLIGMLFSKEKS